MERHRFDFDQIVIGSGFGGAVSALRLSEKGYRVCVLEQGKCWRPQDFPRSNWNIGKYIWQPRLGLKGMLGVAITGHMVAVYGAGVGGGSLVYANAHPTPDREVFDQPEWTSIRPDWWQTLQPFYALAQRMMGDVTNVYQNAADEALHYAARAIGRGDTAALVPIAVLVGEPGQEGHPTGDPYFAGEGPARTYCQYCGGCMIGCRFGAKNVLSLNYLHFAERNGVQIRPETRVIRITPLPDEQCVRDGSAGYELLVERVGRFGRGRRSTLRARGVVVSGGVFGTVPLLLAMRDVERMLPNLSPALGQKLRTNSETMLSVSHRDPEIWRGVAITSDIKPDEETHMQVVRFPKGSDVMLGMLAALPLVSPGRLPYALRTLLAALLHPARTARTLWPFGKARNTTLMLVMQSADTFVRMVSRRPGRVHGTWTVKPAPAAHRLRSVFPLAMRTTQHHVERSGGIAGNGVMALIGRPLTAHPLGGAPIGTDASNGVVDAVSGQVFGYRNLRVLDGSIIPGNLGVNPALTILALSEYLMSNVSVLDAERAGRIAPVRFSPPVLRSVSALDGEGDLYAEALRRARDGSGSPASAEPARDGDGASPTA